MVTCEGKVVESSDVQHVMTHEQSIMCATAYRDLQACSDALRLVNKVTCVPMVTYLRSSPISGGKKSQIWERFQTTGPIGTKFATRMQIHLGMDVG